MLFTLGQVLLAGCRHAASSGAADAQQVSWHRLSLEKSKTPV